MLKSLIKYNKINVNNNTIKLIIIFLIFGMIIVIFGQVLIKIWRTIFLNEGFNLESIKKKNIEKPVLVPMPISVTITDNTISTNQIDPNAAGTFYLTTEKNIGKLNIITMGSDASNVNIDFDELGNSKLLIYPTTLPLTNSHKANIFPVNFTINISFPNSDENITTQYVDVIGNDYKNALNYYASPYGDVSGNFANIALSIPSVQTPIYSNISSEKDVGYVQWPSKNNFSININQKGNLINGIVMNLHK